MKYFRSFRQKYFHDERLKRYFAYSIGEVFLIVLGILVAVWISNWNERVKRKKIEKQAYSEIKNDLSKTLEDLVYDLDRHIDRMERARVVQRYLQSDHPYHDSLDLYFTLIAQDYQLFPKTGAYELLKSRGLEILTNDTLRFHITDLYQINMERVYSGGVDQSQHRNIAKTMEPYIKKYFRLSDKPYNERVLKYSSDTISFNQLELKDYEALKADDSFRITLQYNLITRERKIRHHLKLSKQIEDVIAAIDNEIE